jgi:alpha-glucosidase
LGNHDKPRIASRIGREQARVGAMLQLTLRGIPFIYYGEELGMKNAEIPEDKVQDTFERNSPGLGLGRDPARTPMQWNDSSYAGFSTIKTWLPVDRDYKSFNVESELNNPQSFLILYKKLIAIRKNSQAITIGGYKSLEISTDSLFAYIRSFDDETFLVILNYLGEEQIVNLKKPVWGQISCSTYMDKESRIEGLNSLVLRSYEGLLIKVDKVKDC